MISSGSLPKAELVSDTAGEKGLLKSFWEKMAALASIFS